MFKNTENSKRGFSMLGMLIVIIIICCLWAVGMKLYLRPSVSVDEETAEMFKEVELDISSHEKILESTKKRLKVLEQQQQNLVDNLMDQY